MRDHHFRSSEYAEQFCGGDEKERGATMSTVFPGAVGYRQIRCRLCGCMVVALSRGNFPILYRDPSF